MIRWICMVLIAGCGTDTPPRDGVQAPASENFVALDSTADEPGPTAAAPSDDINPRLLRRFRPVAGSVSTRAKPEMVALGRRLFFDKDLSLHHDVSCNSCHALDSFGVDHRKTSRGSDGQTGDRNAPTVFNAATHIAQFWDGRARTIEDQASGPILNTREMAMPSEQAVVVRLTASPMYVAAFAAAFAGDGEPISMRHLAGALGAFERGLTTTSRWDRYLTGDIAALTPPEKHGLRVFLEVGCMACHTGPQVGGTMFQRVGVIEPWPNQHDSGRIGVTKDPADRMVFKVPTLKNITNTAPYFHDGSVDDLSTAVKMMARHQLGIELTGPDVDAIVTWMASLTGTVDPAYIAPPT
ncbi:MAG TPA: cytochrome c peroxidase [Kofleriaceae bacterium]|nr:cytochrome c peroxidase [Kofleriaceae bacterium]